MCSSFFVDIFMFLAGGATRHCQIFLSVIYWIKNGGKKNMEKLTQETERIMTERFGKDTVIALATTEDGVPYVRYVNAFYEDGAFYIITYALSGKMKQLEKNPLLAVSGEWFTAHGIGENLGYIYSESNLPIAEKLKRAFASWYDNGHNDYNDRNTCILRIRLTDGTLFSHGTRYDIDFKNSQCP